MTKDERHMLSVWVPKSLFHKFKALSALKGLSMSQIVKDLITDWMEGQEESNDK